ncbi:MAG: hypothetical protein MI867_18480, partial [Pseudomonadales bacterium]|nr:hypothetical protein [Pseudomonadales bacterium]
GSEHYPLVDGIPWLLPEPGNSLLDWGAKIHHLNQVFTSEATQLEKQLIKSPTLIRQRLEALIKGKRDFVTAVNQLIKPLGSIQLPTTAVYDSLRGKAPATQNLLSYEANLYRDWGWGQSENQLTADIVLSECPSDQINRLAVLGAGSCRLALDIHLAKSPALTVATDINPLLLLAANHILQGEKLHIPEFPPHPIDHNNIVINNPLSGPDNWPEGFQLLFADAAHPPFEQGAFDAIVTPWVIDIQPLELGNFLKCLNAYLPVGGSWINFGSLVFTDRRDAHCYAIDEMEALAAANGFDIKKINEHEIPYLKSPHNAGYRMEKVWSWQAIKTEDVALPKHREALPEWLLDEKQVIPQTQYFKQFQSTHTMLAEVAAQIDGRASLQKISRRLAKKYNIDPKESFIMVRNLLVDVYQGKPR